MEREIVEQAEVLRDQSPRIAEEASAAVSGAEFQMALLVARGSSDHAALFARYLIEVWLGVPVSLAAPSVLTRFGREVRYPPCLVVGVSQSGAGPDVAEVLRSLRAEGHRVVAVTNTPESAVSEAADRTILLGVGPERAVAATKTFTTSCLALYDLVRALNPALPEPNLPDATWTDSCRDRAAESLGAVLRSDRWFALGRGYRFATAHETALKLMECALLPCKAYSSADFEHGPRALATHGAVAVSFGPAPDGLEAQGCLVESAADAGDSPDSILREVVYGQWLAWLAARARGLDPDRPANLNKVTKTL
jgi:glutamine---fructose-6-phosphate transaminase (isomerizing)